MKKLSIIICVSATLLLNVMWVSAQSSEGVHIVDLSQTEIRIFNKAEKLDTEAANMLLTDSLFVPHANFWSSYVGSKTEFLRWIRKSVYPNLKEMNRLNNRVNREAIVKKMPEADALQRPNVVYVVFGPGCTDVGKFTDGTAVIDLMHGQNALSGL